MINISLTEQDAILFKSFREYQDIIYALGEADIPQVFQQRGGKAILNFAKGGILINIFLNDYEVFRRKKIAIDKVS